MRSAERATARRQLDKRLNMLQSVDIFARPPRGWIKAIREALGMTTGQLGKRIGVTQSRAFDIEKAEISGKLTMESLERAAHALDCRLVYALVPRKPLEKLAEERALALAGRRLQSASHSMALEAQSVDRDDEQAQVDRLAKKLLEQAGSSLWEDE